MKFLLESHAWMLAMCLAAFVGLTGCDSATKTGDAQANATAAHDEHDHADHDHNEEAHEHGEWWCAEHGVPEEECAQCDKSLVAKFKEAGDWCDKHNRPDSQCFICHPENFEKFAARYEAKYGEKPKMPTE
ncbi:MAG: RND transporter [Aureliella sp.]